LEMKHGLKTHFNRPGSPDLAPIGDAWETPKIVMQARSSLEGPEANQSNSRPSPPIYDIIPWEPSHGLGSPSSETRQPVRPAPIWIDGGTTPIYTVLTLI